MLEKYEGRAREFQEKSSNERTSALPNNGFVISELRTLNILPDDKAIIWL